MEYKVPQDVQREDRIVGPFTLQQFMYLFVGAIVGYVVFSVLDKVTGSIGTSVTIGLLFFVLIAAFGILEFQGKPLPEFIVAFMLFSIRPRKRVWRKDIYIPDIAYVPPKKEVTAPTNPSDVKSELEKLAHVLDTRGWGELTEEKEIPEITEAVAEPKKMIVTEEKVVEEEMKKLLEEKETVVEEKPAEPEIKKTPKEIVSQEQPAPTTQPKENEKILPIVEPEKALPKPTEESILAQKELEAKKRVAQMAKFYEAAQKFREEKTVSAITKPVKEVTKKQKEEQKKDLKKFKTTISQVEEILKSPSKKPKIIKSGDFVPKIVSFAFPMNLEEKTPPTEEYEINLQDRITTPRVEESTMNIDVDESQLEDVFESKQVQTIEREIKEVDNALKEEIVMKKPHHLIKEPPSYDYLKKHGKNPKL